MGQEYKMEMFVIQLKSINVRYSIKNVSSSMPTVMQACVPMRTRASTFYLLCVCVCVCVTYPITPLL